MKTLETVIKELNIRTKKDYELDEILIRDALLTLENEYEFYNEHLKPCYLNLEKKYKKGIFDETKAIHLIQNAIYSYQSRKLNTSMYRDVEIPKPERVAMAYEIVDSLMSEMELGNFHN